MREQNDFVFITNNNARKPFLAQTKQSLEKLFKGFSVDLELEFRVSEDRWVKGTIVESSTKKIPHIINRFTTTYVGYYPEKDWEFRDVLKNISNVLYTPGINLNLAVIIHNLRKSLALLKAEKPLIALSNVTNPQGELLASILSAIMGDIVLIGEDSEALKTLAKKFFRDYGVMTLTSTTPLAKKNILNLDTLSIFSHISNMNYIGEYRVLNGRVKLNYVFSSAMIETLLLASGLVDNKKYLPNLISAENVVTIAKVAKKAGFIPLFSTITM